MKDLEFSASDFTAAPTGNAQKMAEWVNKKQARKLEKAVKVWGIRIGDPERQHSTVWCEDRNSQPWPCEWKRDDTHRARIVCIEPITKVEGE